jgi:predicted nucleic acid-binding protein
VKDLVLDASVVLKWFGEEGGRQQSAALSLQEEFTAGRLRVVAPRLLALEVLNVVGRRWRRGDDEVALVAATFDQLRFEQVDPALGDVARWMTLGLTSYDATYVAVAEAAGAELVTDDREILAAAPGIARSLADAA